MKVRLHGDRGSVLTLPAEILGIVTALLAIWQFGAQLGWIPGDTPIERVQSALNTSPSTTSDIAPPTIPTLPSPAKLPAPQNLKATGNCDALVLTWSAVDGADKYRIEGDGHFVGTTSDPSYQTQVFPDDKKHSYRVRATALLTQSDASEPVTVGPCKL
jgi:hypothetical protein